MSDILVHAAILENQKAIINYVAKTIDPSIILDASPFKTPAALVGAPLKGKTWCSIPMTTCPSVVKSWKKFLTPEVKTFAQGFKVCDTSGYFRCGASCTWTVPAGVTKAQFQLWGPGGGTSGQCCCGGSPYGPSGAYMVASLDVTPGASYTLCAGCAYCCWANQTTPGLCQGDTYVTGPNLSICAQGAVSCYSVWHSSLGNSTNSGNSQIPSQDGTGPTQCSGWNFCWDSSSDDTYIPHSFSERTWAVLCADTSKNQTYFGIPGMFPAFKLGCDLHTASCSISTPVFGFENCVCTWSYSGSQQTCTGYGGCYWSGTAGYRQIPGAGGSATYSCGGTDAYCGDSGRMGMICVSYC